MRSLNEGLARIANKEDDCTGRFWQGRFQSQILLDESAVYTCMTYVDLNPLRAGVVPAEEQSHFTSMHYRMMHHSVDSRIRPLNKSTNQMNLRLSDYIILVNETGCYMRNNNSGYLLKSAGPILKRLSIKLPGYLQVIYELSDLFSRGIGRNDDLERLSESLNLRWLKGQAMARQLFG